MQVIHEWIENIAFYSVLMMLVGHILPAGEQKKYVQFFLGLVFVLVVLSPVLRLLGEENRIGEAYLATLYSQEVHQFRVEQERLERDLTEYVQQMLEMGEIEDEKNSP